jgi:hypothetical protein
VLAFGVYSHHRGNMTIDRVQQPSDSPESSWIQTTEGKGWFPILRLYSPLQPYFDKSWGPSEIEAVKTNP